MIITLFYFAIASLDSFRNYNINIHVCRKVPRRYYREGASGLGFKPAHHVDSMLL